jgi:type II secretory pathway pseudopilin PulG
MRRGGLRSGNLPIRNCKLHVRSRGYMLITLMLALALIAVGLLAVLPEIGQQIRRDREEELRHRGTAYMRAIQHFYKKFGRYPSSIEELESTNNVRFLRKRYTDPMNRDPATGKEKDFKLLHQADISLNNGPVLGQTPGQSGLQGQSGFGGAPGGLGGLQGASGGLGAQAGGAQTPPTGDSSNSSSGNASSGNVSDASGNPNSAGSSSSSSGSGFNGPTFGGGPMLGVASTSKAKTIRVFYDKSHYNDWLFIYLPMADRGGLLTGPVNPNMQTAMGGLTPGLAGGVPGQGGVGQGGFGQSGFGQGLGQGLGQGQGLTPNGGPNQGLQPQAPPTPSPTPQQ